MSSHAPPKCLNFSWQQTASLAAVWLLLFLAFANVTSVHAESPSPPISHLPWKMVAKGLEFGEFALNNQEGTLAALRIDPEYFDFALCMASDDEQGAASLKDWASRRNLAAAINASMYLPDNATSTGYMRQGSHVNNNRIVGRFGAFFAAAPKKEGIPRARIIDKDQPDWDKTLENYDLVIQNYRMINAQRRILWSPGGPDYAISAIAEDGAGRILFLHSRNSMQAYDFAKLLLELPLDVRTVMYVEGGAQAGLLVDIGGIKCDLAGTHPHSLLVTGNLRAVLPNILGIRPAANKNTLQNNETGTKLN